MIIGAQLYTLRQHCQTLEDFSETLKKVADIGYKAVQVSGVCPYDGEWLKEQLNQTGLVVPLTHSSFADITEKTEETLKKHRMFDCSRIGLGSVPGGISDKTYDGFIETITPTIRYLQENGAKLYYHNHWQEFMKSQKDGKRFIEKLCETFPPEQLGFTLDTCWAQFAGADPVAWIRVLKDRVDCVHFKDMINTPKGYTLMPVGEGNLNWDGIINACEEMGTEYAFVEQDDCYDENPFDCMKRSFQFLKAQELE